MHPTGPQRPCWCGNAALQPFSPLYLACRCGTLVSRAGLSDDALRGRDDDTGFYGKEYWLSHQREDMGLDDIRARARGDLGQRCLWWLRGLLGYRTPPARVLDVGCAHGAFVALLRRAGYDATGLEVSPWVCRFARETFDVPILRGPVEEQPLAPASLDVVVLNDVIEHLPHPVQTLGRCVELLGPDGLLVFQTPEYPDELSYEEMLRRQVPFLAYLHNEVLAHEHLYLYSRRSLGELLAGLGWPQLCFEDPTFGYDMYGFVSRKPQARLAPEVGRAALEARPGGRLVQAMLDAALPAQGGYYYRVEVGRAHEEIAAAAARIEAAREHAETLRQQVEVGRQQVDTLQQQVGAGRQQIETLQHQVDALQASRASLCEDLHRVGRQRDELRQACDGLLRALNEVDGIPLRLARRVRRLARRYPRLARLVKRCCRLSN
jgi:2-polyprenyl-3-methyl-5-hydroxy-6-metoxy-1,4-benzoquinol methylase